MTERITEKLMEKIVRGDLKMRPRWKIAAAAALGASGLAVALIAALFLAGFAVLAVSTSGLRYLPGFGWRGYAAFLSEFPWWVVGSLIVLLAGVEAYARRFSFAYRRPVLISLGVLVVAVALAGWGLAGFVEGSCPRRPAFRAVLGHFRSMAAGQSGQIHRGKVIEVSPGRFVMMSGGGRREIILPPEMGLPVPPGMGDEVMVFGRRDGDRVQAFGVKGGRPGLLPPVMPPTPCWPSIDSSVLESAGGFEETWRPWR
jgi:hypothetical protein